jgi:amino acid transporter
MAGWGIWIAWATNPPSESAAMIQYMSKYVPGVYSGTSLTGLGVLLGIGFMAVFVAINWRSPRCSTSCSRWCSSAPCPALT